MSQVGDSIFPSLIGFNQAYLRPIDVFHLELSVFCSKKENFRAAGLDELKDLNKTIRVVQDDERNSYFLDQDSCQTTLPNLTGNQRSRLVKNFKCNCLRLDIDEQRQLYLERLKKSISTIESQYKLEDCLKKLYLPEGDNQLTVFGRLSRNLLYKRLNLVRTNRQSSSLVLYALEALLSQIHDDLRENLVLISGESLKSLWESLEANRAFDLDANDGFGMIHSPVEMGRRQLKLEPSFSRSDSGLSCCSTVFGATIENEPSSKKRQSLETQLNLHLNDRYQAIIDYSKSYFEDLIQASCLLKLFQFGKAEGDNDYLKLQELKLYCCIECQNLKSSIKFNWITNCLLLAFKDFEELGEEEKFAQLPSLVPNFSATRGRSANQLNKLTILMSSLLRNFFLMPLIDDLYKLFEGRQLFKNKIFKSNSLMDAMNIVINVELIETSSNYLEFSDSRKIFKIALDFIIDELASVCTKLPPLGENLECLFEDEIKLDLDLGSLPDEIKHKFHNLIDQSWPIGMYLEVVDKFNEESRIVEWLHPNYLTTLKLVNKFRNNIPLEEEDFRLLDLQLEPEPEPQPEQGGASEAVIDHRLEELNYTCKQVILLNRLELNLLTSSRFVDVGFLQLDCNELRANLMRNLQRERSLLIRMKFDDLFKLMEKLRLQFDEIELNIDLESAIENYLADRWQARQQQQPSRDVVLLNEIDDFYELNEPEREDIEFFKNEKNSFGSDEKLPMSDGDRLIGEDEEEFVNALMTTASGNQLNQLQQQQQSIQADRKSPNQLASGNYQMELNRRVAPLIECELLVMKFRYLNEFLRDDFGTFQADLGLLLEGLIFLSEHVSGDLGELAVNEQQFVCSIGDLSIRSNDFNRSIISKSLKNLQVARENLLQLNKFRSQVLSKVVVEFHLLMLGISLRAFRIDETEVSGKSAPKFSGSGANFKPAADAQATSMKSLDYYQESSDLAQKLNSRFKFLSKQNQVLQKEFNLLLGARLNENQYHGGEDSLLNAADCDEMTALTKAREEVLMNWDRLVALVASFWRLVEDYETQQVRWLNLDAKRIDFAMINQMTEQFFARLLSLQGEVSEFLHEKTINECRKSCATILEENLGLLREKFEFFKSNQLPIFKFLTNKRLNETQWLKLSHELSQASLGEERSIRKQHNHRLVQAQNCTTLAQFLELENIEQLSIEKLNEINRQSRLEYELQMFLLSEDLSPRTGERKSQQEAERIWLEVNQWLEDWSEDELEFAAEKLIHLKLIKWMGEKNCQEFLSENNDGRLNLKSLCGSLVSFHCLFKRFLNLTYNSIGLELGNLSSKFHFTGSRSRKNKNILLLSANGPLKNVNLVRQTLFIEFLKTFLESYLTRQEKLSSRMRESLKSIGEISRHLSDFDELIFKVERLNNVDLKLANEEIESLLIELERDTIKLELEREILATKESLALEQQRLALKMRDDCIRQITERAIPAIRASVRALNCLSEKSLQLLRCIKPNPPEAVRLVLEAVCLLRNSCNSSEDLSAKDGLPLACRPVRNFDALSGKIIEDYWPVAYRQLNGIHSRKFVNDLNKINNSKLTPSRKVMQVIRRRYLNHRKFDLKLIEFNSRECAQLAKWLIAVDVFHRVIEVVKPNYKLYQEAELKSSQLHKAVDEKQGRIRLISLKLRKMDDLFEAKIKYKMNLLDSLEECKSKLEQVQLTRQHLIRQLNRTQVELSNLKTKQQRLVQRCLLEASKLIYVESLGPLDGQVMSNMFAKLIQD